MVENHKKTSHGTITYFLYYTPIEVTNIVIKAGISIIQYNDYAFYFSVYIFLKYKMFFILLVFKLISTLLFNLY